MKLSDALRWIQGRLVKRYADQSSREAYAILLCLTRFTTMSQIIMELVHVRLNSDEVKLLQNWVQSAQKVSL